MRRKLGQFRFGLTYQAIANLGHSLEVAFSLRRLLFDLELLEFLLQRANSADQLLFLLPARFQSIGLFANPGELFVDGRQTFARVGIIFFLQRLLLDFQLGSSALQLVNFGRHGVDLNTQRSGGFVDQVNSFVGQEPVGYIAMRQCRSSHNGRILDANSVVHFIAFFQSTENRNRVLDRRLAYKHRLEPALQSRIFFDVLAIFVQRSGANRP